MGIGRKPGTAAVRDKDREGILLTFSRLVGSGYYDSDIALAMADGNDRIERTLAQVVEDSQSDDSFWTISQGRNPSVDEHIDLDEFLSEDAGGDERTLLVIKGRRFALRDGTVGYHLLDSMLSLVLLALAVLGLAPRAWRALSERGEARKHASQFDDDEMDELSRSAVFMRLPSPSYVPDDSLRA